MKNEESTFYGEITAEEKAALLNFQERINTDTGELEQPKTHLQTAPILNVWYSTKLSNDDYHNSELTFANEPLRKILSASKLKACTTPLHFRRAFQRGFDNNMNLNNGSALHTMILEPEKFEYELFDDSKIIEKIRDERPEILNVKSTKEYKEWFSKYKNADGELRDNVLTKEAFSTMWMLKKKLADDEVVQSLFASSERESSLFVSFAGINVKVRPDALKIASATDEKHLSKFDVKQGDLVIISVKTTIDASPAGFLKQCARLRYNLTEAFYYDIIERYARYAVIIAPKNNVHTIFLTLEKDKNEFTGHYLLRPATDGFIAWGRHDYSQNLNVFMSTTEFSEGYEAINGGSTVCEISAPGGNYGK